ncbi:MAG: putative acetyltransferase [Chloroflexi bacterium]|nr:putative acetyltransferase [Chloroflexota bacterium]
MSQFQVDSGVSPTGISPTGDIQSLIIRRMQEKDLQQVQAIDRLSFSLPWPVKAYRYELIENPNSIQWVAEYRQPVNLVVGVIVVWLILDEAHIATIAVHPDYRGQGIAHKILAAALIDSIKRGASQATLEVRAGNQIAQKLYFRFGFEIAGSRPRYYQDNHEDALIMTAKNLDAAYLEWLKGGGL